MQGVIDAPSHVSGITSDSSQPTAQQLVTARATPLLTVLPEAYVSIQKPLNSYLSKQEIVGGWVRERGFGRNGDAFESSRHDTPCLVLHTTRHCSTTANAVPIITYSLLQNAETNLHLCFGVRLSLASAG